MARPGRRNNTNDKEPDDNVWEASFYDDGKNIYEQVAGHGFAIFNRETGKISYTAFGSPRDEAGATDFKLVPLDPHAIDTNLVKLPTTAQEYGSTAELLEEIQAFIHKWLDVGEDFEELASYYILMSWVYDKMRTVCYLRALGDTGTGKSRFLDTIGRICYKPILVTGAATAAPIFRLLEYWRGTLVIDEADFAKSDTHQDIMKILNCGFEADKAVVRCDKDNPKHVDIHRVYGPKVMTSRYTYTDKALESRCITERMRETHRDIAVVLNKDFDEAQNRLRNKLLMYRFKNYDRLGEALVVEPMEGIEPRLRQATHSFSLLFHDDPEMWARFTSFMKKYQSDLIEERAGSWEGRVVNAIHGFIEMGETEITPTLVTEKVNEGSTRKEELSVRRVSNIMKSIGLNFKVRKTGLKTTKRLLVYDPILMNNLYKRYVPDYISPCAGTLRAKPAFKGVSPETPMNKPGYEVTQVTEAKGTSENSDEPQNQGGGGSPSLRNCVSSVTSVTKKVVTYLRENNGNVLGHTSTDIAKGADIMPEKVAPALEKLAKDGVIMAGPDDLWILNKREGN